MSKPEEPPQSDASDLSNPSGSSDLSDASSPSERRLIPKHGGYRNLRSFQVAQAVYDGTVVFCDRFIPRGSRTRDQMVQAARSGVQNIAEGSMASGTSRKAELKLTSVARASLEELLLDFEDFLRQHGLRLWAKDSPEALAVRRRYRSDRADPSDPSDLSDRSDASDASDPYNLRTASAEVAANTLICLIHQASYLLGRQLRTLEQSFLKEGGFTERLYRERQHARRARSDRSERSDPSDGSDQSDSSDQSDRSDSSDGSDQSDASDDSFRGGRRGSGA